VFGGLTTVALFALHGATFLVLRTTAELQERAVRAARALSVPVGIGVVAFLGWTVATAVDHNQRSALPVALPAVAGAVALALAAVLTRRGRAGAAFTATAIATLAWVATVFTGLYPRVLVSNPDFGHSLTVSGAATAHYALSVITVVAVVVTPIVLVYQAWTYRVLRARLAGPPPAAVHDVRAHVRAP
jgi:cytochrome d ubiquinol oxidase subunit II